MLKEHTNVNARKDIMIYLDPILYKAEFAQVKKIYFKNIFVIKKYILAFSAINPKYMGPFSILATTTECDLCNKNGQCVISQDAQVSCECRAWFAGRNCQINLKLLLIVGCVSVILMVVIACGVSCFCCRERGKNDIPCKF